MDLIRKNLDKLSGFIKEMQKSSSGNYKLETIKKHSDSKFLKKIFNYTYDPFKMYGVHTKSIEKHRDLKESINNYNTSIFSLLDDLADNTLTGHAAIKAVNSFIEEIGEKYRPLIYYILDRDLRMGANTTSINKVIPGTIPVFKVALANAYEPKRVDFVNEIWYGSRKLDGVRCLVIKRGNSLKAFSRGGKEFTTLNKILNEVKKLNGDFVLDGEICLIDENGKEDFQGIMKQIKRKNHTIENPKFFVFDYLTLEEFDNHSGTTPLSVRLRNGYDALPESINSDRLDFLPQMEINTEEEFTEMAKDAEINGFEGIMVRKDIGYEGKRSYNLLKVKKFFDAEYKVLSCTNAILRWTEDGQQIERECLSSIEIEHKGYKVSVGSGFSKEQRMYYYENPNELIGKTVCIQYFEESQNQDGGYSLRFPVVKHIFKNGRDV